MAGQPRAHFGDEETEAQMSTALSKAAQLATGQRWD